MANGTELLTKGYGAELLKMGFGFLRGCKNIFRKTTVDGDRIYTSFVKLKPDGSYAGSWDRIAKINTRNSSSSSVRRTFPDGKNVTTDVVNSRFITQEVRGPLFSNIPHSVQEINLSPDGRYIWSQSTSSNLTRRVQNYKNQTWSQFGQEEYFCASMKPMPIWRGLGL